MPALGRLFLVRIPMVAITALLIGWLGSLISTLPSGGSGSPAESAAFCPITVRAYGMPSASDTAEDLEHGFEHQFGTEWNGTHAEIIARPDDQNLLDATPPDLPGDILLLPEPIVAGQAMANKLQFQISTYMWAVVRNNATSPRIDNSNYVRADDWINYMRVDPGGRQTVQSSNPEVQPLDTYPPFPDWDIDLNGTTSLTDLGAVSSRWGNSSTCRGWIRADGNNSGNVSLIDIGVVTYKWGLKGMPCAVPADPDCKNVTTATWTDVLRARIRPYAFKNEDCLDGDGLGDGDPITVVVKMTGADAPSHLQLHGMTENLDDYPIEHFAEDRTRFYDGDSCPESQIMLGTEAGVTACIYNSHPALCVNDRWHVRSQRLSLRDPQHSNLWVYPMTPHFDDARGDCGHENPPYIYKKHMHVKDWYQNGTNYSSMNVARDELYLDWMESGHHVGMAIQNWGNTDVRLQCIDGTPFTVQTDGYVFTLGRCGDVLPEFPCS